MSGARKGTFDSEDDWSTDPSESCEYGTTCTSGMMSIELPTGGAGPWFSGQVAECGRAVVGWRRVRVVVSHARLPAAHRELCRSGKLQSTPASVLLVGNRPRAFADYVVVPSVLLLYSRRYAYDLAALAEPSKLRPLLYEIVVPEYCGGHGSRANRYHRDSCCQSAGAGRSW